MRTRACEQLQCNPALECIRLESTDASGKGLADLGGVCRHKKEEAEMTTQQKATEMVTKTEAEMPTSPTDGPVAALQLAQAWAQWCHVVDLVPTTVKLAPHKTGIEQLLTTAHEMANSNAKLDRATHIQRRWKLAKAWRTSLAAIADDANECTFSVGDRVEVVKDGNQRGKLATVTNGDCNL
jgi:hypothetical protein